MIVHGLGARTPLSIFAFWCSAIAISTGAPLVVAEHDPDPGGSSFTTFVGRGTDNGTLYDNQMAQVFLADSSGVLSLLRLSVSRSETTTTPLVLEITTTDGAGVPTEALGRIEVASDDVPISGTFPELGTSIDVSSLGIVVTQGRQYAIAFKVENDDQRYAFGGWSRASYPGGSRYRLQNGSPWHSVASSAISFRITATPAPEEILFRISAIEFSRNQQTGIINLTVQWSGGSEPADTYAIEWSPGLGEWQTIGWSTDGLGTWSGIIPGREHGFVRVGKVGAN